MPVSLADDEKSLNVSASLASKTGKTLSGCAKATIFTGEQQIL